MNVFFLSVPLVLFFCVAFYFQTITHFSFTIHVLQKDKRTGRPKIWLYHDKETNEPKGDATVTYEDPHAAVAAVEWFNNKDFHGNTIGVYIAESKNKDDQTYTAIAEPVVAGTDVRPEETESDVDGVNGRGRGQIDASSKPWQQEGDWMCPNTRSVI